MASISNGIGNTPLFRLARLGEVSGAEIWVKPEGNNPGGSVKDRAAKSMIEGAEQRGEIRPGDTLIEATSGNTGIALAMIAAIRGYKLKLLMPENMSAERQAAMKAYGAELVLVSRAQGMEGARDLAQQMAADGEGYVLDQFNNPDNPLAHYRTTGPEIWQQTDGRITHFVSAMGTTGTITGVARYLKEVAPQTISPVCNQRKTVRFRGSAAGHRGICRGFFSRSWWMIFWISHSRKQKIRCASWHNRKAFSAGSVPAARWPVH